jgi:hypothetical protein
MVLPRAKGSYISIEQGCRLRAALTLIKFPPEAGTKVQEF